MKRIRLICMILMMAMSTVQYAFALEAELSTAYELSNDEDNDAETLWESYLRIDNAALIGPYLDMNFFGKYTRQDAENEQDDQDAVNDTDIYSAYLHLRSFQNAVELKIGRFSYVGNRFLTLDGAEFTLRTDYYLGATLFGGSPEYFDSDDRHIDEIFRDTGERLYGGKLFLNGVKHTNAYVSYTKEENDEETLQEHIGAGLDQFFSLGKAEFGVGGKMTYDTDQDDIYKGVLRLHMTYARLTVMVDGTRYNVQDGTYYENELVISNFSSGQEDRLSYTVQVALTKNIIAYHGAALTRIEVADDEILDGEIYKLGVDIDYFKTIGVTGNVEGYYYNSEVSSANGASLALEWNITRAFRISFESELLTLDNDTTDETDETEDETDETDETVYSVYLSAEYDILKDFTLSIFCENNEETRYLPENRYGLKAVYRF